MKTQNMTRYILLSLTLVCMMMFVSLHADDSNAPPANSDVTLASRLASAKVVDIRFDQQGSGFRLSVYTLEQQAGIQELLSPFEEYERNLKEFLAPYILRLKNAPQEEKIKLINEMNAAKKEKFPDRSYPFMREIDLRRVVMVGNDFIEIDIGKGTMVVPFAKLISVSYPKTLPERKPED